MKVTKVVSERHYKAGYVLRNEYWDSGLDMDPTLMKKQAYNLNGDWIGDSKLAHKLIVKWGIMPEVYKKGEPLMPCTIGFCQKDQKWYGWSHRAICGFGIGDKLFEEGYGDEHTLFIEHGEKTIVKLNQARQSAIRFARSVS